MRPAVACPAAACPELEQLAAPASLHTLSLDLGVEDYGTSAPLSVRKPDAALSLLEDLLAIGLLPARALLAAAPTRPVLAPGTSAALRTAEQAIAGTAYTADVACSSMPSSRSAGVPSGDGSPALATAVPGTARVCARPGGRAVVQRSVHDLASLQYQRMSAHAWPPSGTSSASGSAMPHMEHWAASSGRSRSRCVAAGGSASARRGLTGSCPGPVSRDSVVTDEACGAMIPLRGHGSPGPRPS